jgi:hypothetical protein
MTYLPSEKAPAPAMPSMMAQFLHLMQDLNLFLQDRAFALVKACASLHEHNFQLRMLLGTSRYAHISPLIPPPAIATS